MKKSSLIVLLTGLCFLGLFLFYLLAEARQKSELKFNLEASRVSNHYRSHMSLREEELRSIKQFFAASNNVEGVFISQD